jgi:hypothetical protein
MNNPTYILNNKAVTDLYGRWPSFHDAKVVAYEMSGNAIGFTLHAWDMTDEVDEKGRYVLKNHALVSFRFTGIHDVNMDSFSSNNILYALDFIPGSDASFKVALDSVMDMDGSFSARFGEVTSVAPCTSGGEKLQVLERTSLLRR